MNGLIFDIQHFSIYDGPGIRTTVFLKGCSLDCQWCHNPESISLKKEVQTYFLKCIGCGQCLLVCPQNAHKIINDIRAYDKENCIKCGTCTDNCYSGALVMSGNEMTVEQVVDEVSRDTAFYNNSNGGVTFSGGEPLLQSGFITEVMKILRPEKIHIAVDTAGKVPFSAFEKVIPYTDLFLYDIKAFDTDIHKEFTGSGNSLILSNLKKLSKNGVPIRIRIPVISGVNFDLAEMTKIAEFISSLNNIDGVEPLVYHSLGAGKLESMGRTADGNIFSTPDKSVLNEIYDLMESAGLNVIRKS